MSPTGLRERKKQQTRQAIHEAAMRLFAERGFEATTIADIAAAADIAPRTFFAYFPSKEEAVFPKFELAIEEFSQRLSERPPGTTAIEVLRDWLHTAAKEHMPDPEMMKLEARLRRDSPTVAACDLRHRDQFEKRLAEAVAEDLDEQPGALRPRIVAGAAVAALQAFEDAGLEVIDKGGEAATRLFDDPAAFLEDGFRFLEAGLAALRD
jgi:AcrR family transcriptional regulator